MGIVGRCFDSLLIKKALRKCRVLGMINLLYILEENFSLINYPNNRFPTIIIGIIILLIAGGLEFGLKLANSTFTGVLDRLQSKRADVWMRPEPDYSHNEPWLAKSQPIMTEKVTISQAIKGNQKTVYYNLLNNFDVGLTLSATFLCSFFTIVALSFLLNEVAHRIRFSRKRRIKIIKRIALALGRFQSKRMSMAIAIFVLFAHIFLWQTQLFLTNNIKVSYFEENPLTNHRFTHFLTYIHHTYIIHL